MDFIFCPCIRRHNVIEMSLLLNLIYRFNATIIKILVSYFVDTEKLILQLMGIGKGPKLVNTILKNKVGGQPGPTFKAYYKAAALITA